MPPIIVTSASCCIVAKKSSLRNIHCGLGSWLTREKQCILERSDTKRLYPVETSPTHPSPVRRLLSCTSANVRL